MKKTSLFLILLLYITTLTVSQTIDPISPDRPGFTNPPDIVLPHHFQIESGFNYQYDNSTGLQSKSYLMPTTLFRYGINQNFEIRLEIDIASQTYQTLSGESSLRGLAPIIIGTKYHIADQKKALPQTSFLFSLVLPYFGNEFFRPQYPAPGFSFLFENALNKKFILDYNAGLQWNGNDANPIASVNFSPAYNITKKLNVFAEIYSYFLKGQVPDYRADGGFAYLPANNIQLDISGGHGITSISPDYFISAGISIRLPR